MSDRKFIHVAVAQPLVCSLWGEAKRTAPPKKEVEALYPSLYFSFSSLFLHLLVVSKKILKNLTPPS